MKNPLTPFLAILPARGRSSLFLLAALFAISAAMRMTGQTGHAIAAGVEGMIDVGTDPAQPEACASEPEIAALLSDLLARESATRAQEDLLADKEQNLRLSEALVTAKLAELKAAEERLAALVATADSAAEDDIQRLTSVYEAMKPKESVPLFEEMNTNFAAGFLGRMRPDVAAEIMAGLKPETAYAISVILAGRNTALSPD